MSKLNFLYNNNLVVMNILEGVKPAKNMNSTKFIIKSKPSLKDTRAAEPEQEVVAASDQDV